MADILARTRVIEGTTAEWTANNLILGDGEFAIERRADGPIIRVGNGTTPALSCPIIGASDRDSPVLTGDPKAPTPPTADNDTSIATTAYVKANLASYAPLASPALTGTPTAPTAGAGTNTTQIATTAFVSAAITALNIGNYAPIASPTFTGDPKAPTAAGFDNDTSIATTAFVKKMLGGFAGVATISVDTALVGGTHANLLLALNSANPQILTLPLANTMPAGTAFIFFVTNTGTFTVNRTSPDVITTENNLAATTVTLNRGDWAWFVSNGSATWFADVGNVYAQLASPTFTGDPKAPTPVIFDNDTSIATTAFVKRTLGGYASVSTITGDTTLVATSHAGVFLPLLSTGAQVITLPLANTMPAGNAFIFFATSTGTWTINRVGTDVIVTENNLTATSITLRRGDWVQLVANGNNTWYADTGNVYATLASPVFTGDPQAPTAAQWDQDTSIATTQFVKRAMGQLAGTYNINGPDETLDAAFAGRIIVLNSATPVTVTLPAASAILPGAGYLFFSINTGVFTIQRGGADTIHTGAALGATSFTLNRGEWIWVVSNGGGLWYADKQAPTALLDSPAFIGNPTAPTPTAGDNDTSIATTAFVTAAIAAAPYAPIASPIFTGDPRAPTPLSTDNDTSIATTAFVQAVVAAAVGGSVVTPPLFDNDTSIATTAFVRRELGSHAGFVGIGANTTLTAAAHANKAIYNSVAGAITLTLPAANTFPNGGRIIFVGLPGSGVATVNRAGTDTIGTPTASGQTSFTVQPGATVLLDSDGASVWTMTSLFAQVSVYDTGANRIMRVGGFGVGTDLLNFDGLGFTDLNQYLTTGNYHINSAVVVTNMPAGAANGVLVVSGNSGANWRNQQFTYWTGANSGITYERVCSNGTWSAWRRMMAVGEFGIGLSTTASISDANALLVGGLYSVGATWTGSVFPAGDNRNYGSLLVQSFSDTTAATQMFISFQGASNNAIPAVYIRSRLASNWGGWQEILAGFSGLFIPTFANGFFDSNTFRYSKVGRMVTVQGVLGKAGGWVNLTNITTLPAGYRPAGPVGHPVMIGFGNLAQQITNVAVNSDGTMMTGLVFNQFGTPDSSNGSAYINITYPATG